MATILLKKSYLIKTLKQIPFDDLWNSHGVFTTMRLIEKPLKIIFFREHINNLLNSSKVYKVHKLKLREIINKLVKLNIINKKKYNHLIRVAINKTKISISIRKRINPAIFFSLKFFNYKRIQPEHKNLKYKKILKKLEFVDTQKYDLAICHNKKILETATANFIFIKDGKYYSPKSKFYKGITLKFFDKNISINYKEIFLKNLKIYDEIILIGSGKGVVSVNKIDSIGWSRKSTKYYKILNKIYNKAVTKCPRYYS